MGSILAILGTTDTLALLWFILCWVGYTAYADHFNKGRTTLFSVMRDKREMWMRQMLVRENRVVDVNIMATLMRSVSLFASTTIFILAGLMAILGASDKAQALLGDLPFAVAVSRTEWEIKVLLLLVIFVYAFFKFAWALRQFNYTMVLLGAAPSREDATLPDSLKFAASAAEIITLSVHNFNRGLRAYYFGLASLSWFIHPVFFALSSLWVVAVLYRREFLSKTLAHLGKVPVPDDIKKSKP